MGCLLSKGGYLELPEFSYPGNKFTANESQALFYYFQQKTKNTNGYLTLESFPEIFPYFKDHKEIAESLFYALDLDRNGLIHFGHFLAGLSVIVRGDYQEKMNLIFDIVDLNKDYSLTKEEILETFSTIAKVTEPLGYEHQFTPQEALEMVFGDRDDKEQQEQYLKYVKTQEVDCTDAEDYEDCLQQTKEDSYASDVYEKMQKESEESAGQDIPMVTSTTPLESATNEEKVKDIVEEPLLSSSGIQDSHHDWFFIRSVLNGLFMDVKKAGVTTLTKIILWTYNGKPNQQWRWEGDRLINRETPETVAVGYSKAVLGKRRELCLKNFDDPTCAFEYSDRYFKSKHRENYVLDIRGAKMHSKGDQIIVYPMKMREEKGRIQSNQLWEMIPVCDIQHYIYRPLKVHWDHTRIRPNQEFKIVSQFNNLILSCDRKGTVPETRIVTWEDKNDETQLWYWDLGCIRNKKSKLPLGYISNALCLVSDTSANILRFSYDSPYLTVLDGPMKGRHLDIQGADSSRGAPIIVHMNNEQANQRYDIVGVSSDEKAEEKEDNIVDIDVFMEKLGEHNEVEECFGLFPLIHKDIVQPIEKKATAIPKSKHGWLSNNAWSNKRYCLVEGGFITVFDSEEDFKNRTNGKLQWKLWEANARSSVSPNEFIIRSPEVTLVLHAESEAEKRQWIFTVNENVHPTIPHKYRSYAPVRDHAGFNYFENGEAYYLDLMKELRSAKKSIFIAGWFLSPYVYLKRSKTGPPELVDRLDQILLDRAQAGVKIYILIWNEISAAFKLGSKFVMNYFHKLHPNFQVIRDPRNDNLKTKFMLWSQHQKICMIDQRIGYAGGIDLAFNRFDIPEHPVLDEDNHVFFGPDYVNPMIRTNYLVDHDVDTLDRSKECRMPWVDHQAKVTGTPAWDLCQNFIQRWNHFRPPAFDVIILDPIEQVTKGKFDVPYPDCTVQVLRSIGNWSFGVRVVEISMYYAHLEAIEHAKHYIYIENQFFVSAISNSQENPRNKIVLAFYSRIKKAILNNEDFKILFATPVHSSSDMRKLSSQVLMNWQLKSSSFGKYGLINVLRDEFPDVDIEKYFKLISMRNWGQYKSGQYTTEMVYVHSKMMIIDDDVAFISSANINDRSMLGYRDSEIGVKVSDNQKIEVMMNGKKTKVSKAIHEFRMAAWRTLLQLNRDKSEDDIILDPIKGYETIVKLAHQNTDIYIDVFQKIADNIRTTTELHYMTEYYTKLLPRNVERLKDIKGIVVNFPENFLRDAFKSDGLDSLIDKFWC